MAGNEIVGNIVREYRIVLPISVEEYQVAQLYAVAEASKNETGGGEGIEVITNEPFESTIEGECSGKVFKGQYTHKVIHLSQKVPRIIRALAPKGSLEIIEKAWNAYPYCRTVYTNDYMADNFFIVIESRHEPGTGEIENVHQLSKKKLEKRNVDVIDIVNDPCRPNDYKAEEDPSKVKSEKTGRGPLIGADWSKNQNPVMCCYKLYDVKFKWLGLQTHVESLIMKSVRNLLFNFHRQVFCWIDKWHGMTIEDIRVLEEQTKKDLDQMRQSGEVKGTVMKEK
ncbi:phosphatidylinositol transfer protein alpha isoform [Hydra vulgaris]|uniref:Phosphatidylinositol transfer protein alpha isoform n=1 Tax=Hydra vulgaris TaxID=6087 RepID=T2MEA9_HYDVU|nr:phosphatidylinositol transfer protein alpha isoform [Hydra vulgaris]